MKKIMFNDKYGLTVAVLNGEKTMTRRIVSIPDTWHGIDVCFIGPDTDKRSLLLYNDDEFLIEDRNTGLCGQVMPHYKIGKEIAVAQSYKSIEQEILKQGLPINLKDEVKRHKGYNNKMFVKAEDMPHRIRITDIKVERLHDISNEDCLLEGIYMCDEYYKWYTFNGWVDKHKEQKHAVIPKQAFAALIDKVSGKGTWKNNPWVFVYSFELIK